jgi:lysyl-tRNA synthetase, class II
MRSAARVAAIAAGLPAGIAIAAAATGWLYVLGPVGAVPGPRIGEALPLDELARRGASPLAVFVVVWAAAAAALGLVARALRADRPTAAVLLALGVGAWAYLTTGASIAVVRQIPPSDAFHAAASLRAVYLPAALAGFAGAVAGRTPRREVPRAPLLLAVLVGAVGLLGVLDAVLPPHGDSLFASLVPASVRPLAHALVPPLGLALLAVSRGLVRRKRRAWQLALALLGGLSVIHVMHRFDEGAVAALVVALLLVAFRHDFDQRGDPSSRPRVALHAAAFVTLIYVYGALALWWNRLAADRPYSLSFAARETTDALLFRTARGSSHLAGPVGEWFPVSVLLLGLVATATIVAAWLAPWRHRVRQQAHERETAHALVQAWGMDTLAPFVLRGDKSYFFSEDEQAFLAYRVVGGVAIVSGDPIGPPELFDGLVARFATYARARDWRIAILGVSERRLALYRAHGLHALYHGDEAVVDAASFSLDGRAIRKVRQSVHRLERIGYRAELLHAREIPPELRARLETLAQAWRGTEPNRGFVMALDGLFRLDDEDALFAIGLDPDGEPAGFLHFAVSRCAAALSLSSMPRLRSTPNGFNEWLVCATVVWAREHGYERISLNFAPFAALLAPEAKLTAVQRAERRALLALKGRFQLDNLLTFNRKFLPGWERRFVVYERRRDLPRVGIAALAAEAYLPFSGRHRK